MWREFDMGLGSSRQIQALIFTFIVLLVFFGMKQSRVKKTIEGNIEVIDNPLNKTTRSQGREGGLIFTGGTRHRF